MKYGLFHSAFVRYAAAKNIPLKDGIRALSKLGFTLSECDITEITREASPGSLYALYGECGAEIETVHGFFDLSKPGELEEAEKAVKTVSLLGTYKFMIIPGISPCAEKKRETADAIARGLCELCDFAAGLGTEIYIENFSQLLRPYSTVADLVYMFGKVPGLKYNYDTGNFAFIDEDETEIIPLLSDRISHVHLKDLGRRLSPEHGDPERYATEKNFATAAPGDGRIKVDEIMRMLDGIGFSGNMIVEHNYMSSADEYVTFCERSAERMNEYKEKFPAMFARGENRGTAK